VTGSAVPGAPLFAAPPADEGREARHAARVAISAEIGRALGAFEYLLYHRAVIYPGTEPPLADLRTAFEQLERAVYGPEYVPLRAHLEDM
jgi:hypothetical protein